jgi:hypothetical protein
MAAMSTSHTGAEKVPVRWSPLGKVTSKEPVTSDEVTAERVMVPVCACSSAVLRQAESCVT